MIGRSAHPPGTVETGRVATYVAPDGTELHYRTLDARDRRGTVVYLHGIESHGGWFLPMAGRLAARGYTVHLLDRRGSGLNRDGEPGHADSADQLLDDVRAFRRDVADGHLIGLSWGGKLALASALRDPAGLRTLTLITPGLVPRVDLDLGAKLRLLAASAVGRRAFFDVPIESDMFTRTPDYLRYIERDPLRLKRVTNRLLLAGLALDARIRRGLSELGVPTLLLLAEHDRIIDNEKTRELLERAPPGRVREELYRGATHSIQFDDVDALERDLLAHFGHAREREFAR